MAFKLQLLLTQLVNCIPPPTPTYTTLAHTPTASLTTMHTATPTPAQTTPTTLTTMHTPTSTPVHTAPTPTDTPTTLLTTMHTPAPGSATEIQLLSIIQRLRNENSSLRSQLNDVKDQYAYLEEQLRTLNLQLAQVLSAPRLRENHQRLRRGWHQQACDIIGAAHSRVAPTNTYKCVHSHEGCTWVNKKITLQAYVLHLKRKHGENVSENPDLSLLPVLSH